MRLTIPIFAAVVSLSLTTWVGLSNIEYAERNKALAAQLEKLKGDLDLYKTSSVYWKEKCEHYQSANEALINVTTTEQQEKAIRATPLPPLQKERA